MMKTKFLILITAISFSIISASCRNDDLTDTSGTDLDLGDYTYWSASTHGKLDEPNYSEIFNQNKVIRLDIKIEANDWEEMQADLSSLLSNSSMQGPQANTIDTDPMWVPCTVIYDGIEWWKVGIRYKGNSSLQSTYRSGNKKLPFKLDFDQFEDNYPQLEDQRFYGFRQFSLKNNYQDVSQMREKVASDLFNDFGLVSPQTAFCELYVDSGEGSVYYGVYTIVEEVDDTVIETQFTSGEGNLYKPDGTAASFAQGSFNTSQMEIKTNEETSDYSDVKALYNVINSSERSSDAESWKTKLEAIFDVHVFLKWLAANTTIQNWDTYGKMTHNYYLYNNPENGLLTWIPWDNNEAFETGKQGGALSISMSEVGSNWPLIRYILDQDEYLNAYKNYLQEFTEEIFTPDNLNSIYSSHYQLLKDYVYAEESGYTFLNKNSDFDDEVDYLKSHVQSRNQVVANYLQQ